MMASAPGQTRTGPSNRLVELVDLMPTLADVSGIPVPPLCVGDEPPTSLCVHGTSWAGELGVSHATPAPAPKTAAYSQFPRSGQGYKRTRMGYTIRTATLRYVEWVDYNQTTFRAEFGHVYSRELYNYTADYHETTNLAGDARYAAVVSALSTRMHEFYAQTFPPPA